MLVLVLAWPLAAFGGVYGWAVAPYLIGCGLLAAMRAGGIARARAGTGWLDLSLAGLVAGAWFQVVPLPRSVLTSVSPRTLPLVEAVRLLGENPRLAGISVAPGSTVWAAGVLTATVLLFLAARVLLEEGGVRWPVRVIAWLGIASATLGLAQAASGSGAVYWWWEPFGEGAPPFGTFINRNHFATWVVMATPACFGYALARMEVAASHDATRHWTARLAAVFDGRAIFLLFAGILMTVALFVDLSRSGIVGLAVATVFVLLAGHRRIERARRRRRVAAWVILSVVTVAAFADTSAVIRRFNQAATAGSGRLDIWRETLPIVRDFWLTGTGAGTYQTAMLVYQESDRVVYFNQAHNQYLQVAAEGGLLLSVPAAAALLAFLRLARRRLRGDRTAIFWIRIGAAGGLVAVMVQNLWETGLRMPANAALAAVLAAVLVHTARPRPQRPHETPG